MILKEIVPGMVIHCKTVDEAKALVEHSDMPERFVKYWDEYAHNTCYYSNQRWGDVDWTYSSVAYFSSNTEQYGEIIPFSSLIIEEKTYEDGLNEAWGLYNKIYDMSYETRNKVFGLNNTNNGMGSIYRNFTPQVILAKLAEYEAKQFTAGDVVQVGDTSYKAVVTRVEEEVLYIVYADGSTGERKPDNCIKTGKKVDLTALFSVFEENGNEK